MKKPIKNLTAISIPLVLLSNLNNAKKRPYLLLEILVGLGLLSMLLSFLFISMAQSASFETKIEQSRKILLQRQSFQARLQDLFLSIKQSPAFYTQKFPKEPHDSLIALFDHGIDPDPAFSGLLSARLFIDSEHNLCLATWPESRDDSKRPWRKEVLLSDVDRWDWEFFSHEETLHSRLPCAWTHHWPKTKQKNPMMVKLTISQKKHTFSFAFFLPAEEPIFYPIRPTS